MRAAEVIAIPTEVPFTEDFIHGECKVTEGIAHNILEGYHIRYEHPGLEILRRDPWSICSLKFASAHIEIGSSVYAECIKQSWGQFYQLAFTSICAIPQVANTVESEFLWAASSTTKTKQENEFEAEIWALFEAAKSEIFEDGIESRFSNELIRLIMMYGCDAVTFIADLTISGHTNPEVASEALRWIGRINHPQSYSNRLWLLESCLNCTSSRIRDGAILGLAAMDDPNAIPYIKSAMRREDLVELKQDMQQVIDQLEKTIGGIHLSTGKEK